MAMTVPREGLSLAVSGSTMPPAVFSSTWSRSTTTWSPIGCSVTLVFFFVAVAGIGFLLDRCCCWKLSAISC